MAAWLGSLVGPDSSLSWDINDCGEQTGVPDTDATRDLPMCAELVARLSPRRSVHLSFLVGTRSQGVVEARALYLAGVIGAEGDRFFPDLKALAVYLREVDP